jgi:GMP synthase (glutamine-hydrolysing)
MIAAVGPRVLVVQSDPDKPLGRITTGLERAGISLEVRSPTRELPPIAGYGGLIALPGLADPVDRTTEVDRVRETIGEALAADLPVLGLCLGGQLLVQALGGDVYRCTPELGFRDVVVAPDGAGDPLLQGAPGRFSIFHAHCYAFTPPSEAQVLLENEVCVQACRLGRTWAFQCHPEASRSWVQALAAGIRGGESQLLPATTRFFVTNGISAETLEQDLARADERMDRLAAGIASGFAAALGSVTAAGVSSVGATRARESAAGR